MSLGHVFLYFSNFLNHGTFAWLISHLISILASTMTADTVNSNNVDKPNTSVNPSSERKDLSEKVKNFSKQTIKSRLKDFRVLIGDWIV